MIISALHTLTAGLARRTWLGIFATIVVCCGFAAHAVASLVEASYLGPPAGGPLPPAPTKAAPTIAKPPDATALVDRNMFCSSCVRESGPTGVPYSGTPAVLIATSIGVQSRATVRVISSEVQGSWGVGDTIPGVGRVDQINFASIEIVDKNGIRGKLSLADLPVSDRGPGAATSGATDPAKPPDPYADRIKKIDDHTFEVDRSLVRELVTSGGSPNGMRALPLMENGEIAGLRITQARPGSIGAAVGLKPGDKLVAINNDAIKSAQQMLNVLASIDKLNVVQLQGTRGQTPLQIELRLK